MLDPPKGVASDESSVLFNLFDFISDSISSGELKPSNSTRKTSSKNFKKFKTFFESMLIMSFEEEVSV